MADRATHHKGFMPPPQAQQSVADDNGYLRTRRADLAPASADRDARTVEVIWSTGAPVRRRDIGGPYIERLSLAPDTVDLSRLEGASVLDAHRQSAVRDVLGTVRSATVDGQQGTATLQFSARPEVEPLCGGAGTRVAESKPSKKAGCDVCCVCGQGEGVGWV